MKKLLLTSATVLCAAGVFAQGTVIFNNRPSSSTLLTRIYIGGSSQIRGSGTDDVPAGTQSWVGFTSLTGSGFRAAILAANGASVAESSLTFGTSPMVQSFRGGLNAGGIAGAATATLNQVTPDGGMTMEIFAWDDRTAQYDDPNVAIAAWRAGTIAGGTSNPLNLTAGGLVAQASIPVGLESFNIYTVPEPSTMALAGLGAAALLIFRRRK